MVNRASPLKETGKPIVNIVNGLSYRFIQIGCGTSFDLSRVRAIWLKLFNLVPSPDRKPASVWITQRRPQCRDELGDWRDEMAQMSDKQIQRTRFRVGELQKRIAVLEATREDLERQIRKLSESVPEDSVEATEQREGYVAYGSYAQSVIARKSNLRLSLDDIVSQTTDIAVELRDELDALDSYERIRARRLAQQAESRQLRAG